MKKKSFHNINISNKNIITIFIILSLSTIYNFPKNIFNLISKNFDQRNIALYDYCNKESLGFLSFIKKKYKNYKSFELYNYFISPNPSWFLENLGTKKNDKFKILLGYKNKNLYKFLKYKNNFRSVDHVKDVEFIEYLSFFNNSSKTIYNSDIKIFTNLSNFDHKEIIYEKNLKIINPGNNIIYINKKIDKKIHKNIQLIFEFKNTEHHKLFTDIAISKKKEFDLDKYQILEQHNNCYLIKKL